MRFVIDYNSFFDSPTNGVSFNTLYFAFLSKSGIDTSMVKTVGYAKGNLIVNKP